MEITEKWLGEIGGWAAMKAARGLADAGLATVQSADMALIRGQAGGGKMKFACGLRMRSRTDVDNLCTCPAARRGMICEHSLAVALMHLRGRLGGGGGAARAQGGGTAVSSSPASAQVLEPLKVPGQYRVYLPENLLDGGLRDTLAAYVKFEPGGEGECSLLASWLAVQGVKGQSTPLSVRGGMLDEMLSALAEHPRVVCGKPSGSGRPAQVAEGTQRLPLSVTTDGDDAVFTCRAEAGRPLFASEPARWWVCKQTGTLFRLPKTGEELRSLLQELVQRSVRRSLLWLVARRAELEEAFLLDLENDGLRGFHVVPVPATIELALEGSLQVLEARVTAEFQGKRWSLLENQMHQTNLRDFPIQDESNKSIFYTENKIQKQRFIARMKALGFVPQQTSQGEFWRLTGSEKILAFYASELPRLRHEVKVVEGERWRTLARGLARISPVVRPQTSGDEAAAGSGMDWLAMEFAYTSPDGYRLPRAEVLRLLRSGQRAINGPAGRKYVLDLRGVEEFEETLRDVPLEITPDGAKVRAFHAPYLLGGEAPALALPQEETIQARIGGLADKLRPYQLLGVRWMYALAESGRGGVLGDEMGLGKTVQSIALITSLTQAATTPGQPVLVVCPKSLTGNWRDELARFAPELKVCVSVGSRREEELKSIHDHDVIITTYQLVVRDLYILRNVQWRLILLDEASHIRNPDTEAAKALRTLPARARLALTGTPVENSVRDLWSIYHFVLPGYLGGRETFKERFEQPLASLGTPAAATAGERLKKLIRPYFLRRTKREVLRDLPEKIEQILWCDPSPSQAEVYRRILEEGREEIKAARKRSGQGGAKMTMFTVLLRLRQACCDLRLTGLGEDALKGLDGEHLSGKWPMLNERLEEIFNSGGKALIFSQFVQFLRLVRADLESRKIAFCYLDGSSQDREAQVKSFQTDPQRQVFLISLKAGGYGLNLTAADHVILLDPWWNPAVEAQAIDRAHRIGQQRVVTAARLAMRGTVEERILALQDKKRGLVEAALDEESPLMSGLQIEDLEQLMED